MTTEGRDDSRPWEMSPPAAPTAEQVDARAAELAAGPDDGAGDPAVEAKALLRESEERVEDPATRDPADDSVIRRQSDDNVPDSEAG